MGATLRLAWRLLWRERRDPALHLLLAGLFLACLAVATTALVNDRLGRYLAEEGRALLGGDLVLVSDTPPAAGFAAQAEAAGLRFVDIRQFPSMLQAEGAVRLVDVKAVGDAYPLYGKLAARGFASAGGDIHSLTAPQRGEAWVDEGLARSLSLQPGTTLGLGRLRLRVAGVLAQEPDRSFNPFALAPRVLIALADLPASGLDQPGARIAYRLAVAGPPDDIAALREVWMPRLQRGQRLEGAGQPPPELQRNLERVGRFLAMAGGLTLALAAVGVFLSSRQYLHGRLQAGAIQRCLGMSRQQLLAQHGLALLGLALLAALLGGLGGWVAHRHLLGYLGELLTAPLPLPGIHPLLLTLATAFGLLAAATVPALRSLSHVPPGQVLRASAGEGTEHGAEYLGADERVSAAGRWAGKRVSGERLAAGVALAGVALLVTWVAGGWPHGALLASGLLVVLLLLWAGLRAALLALAQGLARLPGRGSALRLLCLGLHRRGGRLAVQATALALALFALQLLTTTREQMLAAWQASVPAEAPNHFAINIQPDQRVALSEWLVRHGIVAELSPMVRGRLVSLDGRPVSAADYPDDERAQRLVEREFNLSWASELPPANQISAGRWFAPPPGDPETQGGTFLERGAKSPLEKTSADASRREMSSLDEASVEAGLAERLGIRPGSRLVFKVDGEPLALTVTSLRRLAWDSMRVNFFVLMPPGRLAAERASYITSFYLPPAEVAALAELGRDFPNLTLIDVGAMLSRLRVMTGQLSSVLLLLFSFSTAAGVLILLASLHAQLQADRRQWAVLRVLGASRGVLAAVVLGEVLLCGALAGALGGVLAALAGKLLARQWFEIVLPFDLAGVAGAVLLGMALSLPPAWWQWRQVSRRGPLAALRA